MATADKKKKEAAPVVRFQDDYDAKATSHAGNFIIWAMRNGERSKATAIVLTRKEHANDKEKGITVTREEIPALRALLEHFEAELLPRLDKYGIVETEED